MTFQEFLSQQLFTFPGGDVITVRHLFFILLILVIARVLIWLINHVLLGRWLRRRKVDIGRRYTILQIARYVIYLVAVLLALQAAGVSISVLVAGSAALLVGLGLGLQQSFNDLISGLIILVEGTIEVGDIVEVDGRVVTVKKIGLRTSVVESRDEISIIIPNSKVILNSVTNWSHNATPTRFQVAVGVAYGSDVEKVTELLLEAAQRHPLVLDEPKPKVEFRDFGNSSLDFVLHFFSNEFFRIEFVKSDIRFFIDELFRKNEIVIPFPQRDIWIRNQGKE
jgi:small-conductance mechanosensitive channel